MKYDLRPLDRVSSIKTKLGLLVAVTIVVASVLAVIGTRLGISPLATVPVAVVVALAVTQLLARGMTSPLREMTLAAQRMAQGDYSERVHVSSRDEVGELARAFNRTAATLEMVDRHRRDLVANVSHELRTPISALQAVLENLVDGVSNPGPGELRTALAQTERLGRLVGDLLDLSRVEEGVTPLRLKEVRLRDIFDDAVAQARADGVRYAVDVRPETSLLPQIPTACTSCWPTSSTTRPGTAPPAGRSGSAPNDWATTSCSPLPTRDRVSLLPTGARCSNGSPRAPLTAAAQVSA